jgi:pimeloyl-ACP methyl ester carboxylesterase
MKAVLRAILALLLSLPFAAPALAQRIEPAEVARWAVYGTRHGYLRDGGVPGGGALRVAAPATPGEDWSSGAGMPVPLARKAGERLSATFWARAARPVAVPVALRDSTAPYRAFASSQIRLTIRWQRFTLTGIAPADLEAGSQRLTVQLGKAGTEVVLGPALFVPGAPDSAQLSRAFAGFRPVQLAEDFPIPTEPGVTLAATLRLPMRQGDRPFPVVLLLNGSGPSLRGIFPLVQDRLLADGIATLDYDKRGAGESTGAFLDTLPLLERDAAAVIGWLRSRGDIDAKRIAVFGLSQGGVIGPALAARDPGIAAVVMLAGPVGARGEPFLEGLRSNLAKGGVAPDAIARVVAAARPFLDARVAKAPPAVAETARGRLLVAFVAAGFSPEQAGGAVGVMDDAAMLSMYDVTTDATLAAVRAPVLALYAGEDETVSTPLSMPAAQAALRGNRDATVIVVPGMNHIFQDAKAGDLGKAERRIPAVSEPQVVKLVGDWLAARLRR